MEKRIIELYRRKFDDIRHEADGIEYWYARELMKLLDYVQWRNFDNAINKAMISCKNNGNVAEDHFSRINNTIEVGNGALREVEDYSLLVMHVILLLKMEIHEKEQIAFAQSYFAVQTRKQELIEERISYIERTEARGKLRESEKRLSQNIYERGVDDAKVETGWVVYNRFAKQLFEYPAFAQIVDYEPFDIQDKKGTIFKTDLL